MGTTAQKLEYLGTTKSQLKTMINYGLDDNNKITSSTTFRNYVLSIKEAFLEALRDSNTLFTNLPKKTGSGSNITLNGTAYAPMRLTLETNTTTQASTPTPSSPQEVKTVTGLQEIKSCARNLFNKDTIQSVLNGTNDDGIITSNTWASGSWVGTTITFTPMKISSEFTISMEIRLTEGSTGTFSKFNDGVQNLVEVTKPTISTQWQKYVYKYTPSASYTINKFFVQMISINGSIEIKNMQLEYGSSASTYEPYQEQVSEINLGKNVLIHNSTYINASGVTFTKNDNGSITVSGTATANSFYRITENINLPAGKWTLSGGYINSGSYIQGQIKHSNGTYLFPYTSTDGKVTFDIVDGDHIDYIQIRISSGTDTNNYTFYPQLERGTQATLYSEYFTPIELCKIGTYEDKIFKTTGKNLLDISKIKIGKTWSGDTNTQRATILWIPIKANQRYNFVSSWTNSNITNIRVVLNHGSSDQANNLVVSSFPFTNTTWEYASIEILANTTFTEAMLQNVYVMLCEGTNTEYEPYGSGEWYVKKAIGKKILNGSENWLDSGYNSSAHHYTYQGANKMGGQTNLISNKFVTSTSGTLVYSCVGNASNTNITLKMPLDISTTAQMKTWLGSNNTTVYFVQTAPTYEKLNDTLQEELENACYGMLSYKGQTNIMVESNILPFIVNAVAIEQ